MVCLLIIFFIIGLSSGPCSRTGSGTFRSLEAVWTLYWSWVLENLIRPSSSWHQRTQDLDPDLVPGAGLGSDGNLNKMFTLDLVSNRTQSGTKMKQWVHLHTNPKFQRGGLWIWEKVDCLKILCFKLSYDYSNFGHETWFEIFVLFILGLESWNRICKCFFFSKFNLLPT